jgi:peptidoglycan/LPS O-acetylase OafA/YrhL
MSRAGQPMLLPLPSRSRGRIPSLDGLRAISISMVILSHLAGTRHFPQSALLGDLGELGVRIFFVISGFLITTLLLEEHADTGRISLPWFYFRRTMRIFPAAYAFIGVIFVLNRLNLLSLYSGDMLHALSYTMNYHLDRAWPVGHLWSLSVEEQFYLLWPAGLALLAPARALWLALGCIISAPLIRIATWVLLPGWRGYIDSAFPTVCDSLAVGCALALLRGTLEQNVVYVRWLTSRALLGLPFAILAMNEAQQIRLHDLRVFVTVGETLLYLLIALWIHRSAYVPADGMGRFLNWPACRYLGRLSYSLYIWQQIFLDRTSASLVAAFPVNLLCVAVTGVASYYFVESPFLDLRSRLERAWRGKAHPLPGREPEPQVSRIEESRRVAEPGSAEQRAGRAPAQVAFADDARGGG